MRDSNPTTAIILYVTEMSQTIERSHNMQTLHAIINLWNFDRYRIRLVVGGDKLDYDLKDGSPEASTLETKLFFNSIWYHIQKKDIDSWSVIYKKNSFYIPPWTHFRIHANAIQILSGEYSNTVNNLEREKFREVSSMRESNEGRPRCNICPTKHKKTSFCLCVDDFGIKYHSTNNADRILNAF